MQPQLTQNSILDAASWLQHVLLGTTATIIATMAIASIGVLMLTGRIDMRRGATVVVGCFMVFGAPLIAAGLQSVLGQDDAIAPVTSTPPPPPPPPIIAAPAPSQNYDPYAGAAVPSQR